MERIFVYKIELVKTIKIHGGIIMKKTALLIIALAFALTGCASMEGEKETSSIPTETIVSMDNAPAQTTEPDKETAENVTEIFDVLNTLEYQPYTCDGLPEYLLTATDGTVYSINFSEKWIWRGNSEQAELSDELIALLKENKTLTQDDSTMIAGMENVVREIGRTQLHTGVELSVEDAGIIAKIIDNGIWIEDTPNCRMDCSINLNGRLYYYSSHCGTLEELGLSELSYLSSTASENRNKTLKLSDAEKDTVNTILEKYITFIES